MDPELRRLRDRLSRDRGYGEHRPRFPRGLRQEVADLAHRRSREGTTLHDLAEGLGIGRSTLQNWIRRFPASNSHGHLRAVEISESRTECEERPILVLPDGTRVEGLSTEALITVLRGLR